MASLPHHIAIIMDGNGRWAERRKRPRNLGHQTGVKALRKTVEHCARTGIGQLTVFAFSSENWQRPPAEISRLMELFMRALDKEVSALDRNRIRVRFIGDRSAFDAELRARMDAAEEMTRDNRKMTLNVAANYGGRWDILQAARHFASAAARGEIDPDAIDQDSFRAALALAADPEPDLFIRTGGEMRISNFMLWQCAYTELYFTPTLWPDFDAQEMDRAINAFQVRERRFGRTGQQLRDSASA